MKKTVLVTGGCGYIGSHVTRQLSEAGYQCVVIDNLSTGFASSLLHKEILYKQEIADEAGLDHVFAHHHFDGILHFAASIVVPDSVAMPLAYYENNTINFIKLLKASVRHGVKNFIFSSTAATYGEKYQEPVKEDFLPEPTNPYGRSKLMDEWILRDVAQAHGLKYVVLRYFNVAGADPLGRLGQKTPQATHLIKVACEVALNKRPKLSIFGDDYKTPDGTGVRDYIHVEDLASAHLAALSYLQNGGESDLFNCGYGSGNSVKEVLAVFKSHLKINIATQIAPRRPGDVDSLVANVDKIKKKLPLWKPRFNDLAMIIQNAYDFEAKLPLN